MARKIARRSDAPPPAPESADELDVLHPERALTVGGRRIEVREYGHIEWLRLLPAAAPLVASIAEMLEAGREPAYEDALAAIAAHADALMPLVAQACDVDVAVLEALDPIEGEMVLMTWWGANGRFFGARALNRVAVARAERRAAGWDTARSTPPSSRTDTTDANSAPTPSGS